MITCEVMGTTGFDWLMLLDGEHNPYDIKNIRNCLAAHCKARRPQRRGACARGRNLDDQAGAGCRRADGFGAHGRKCRTGPSACSGMSAIRPSGASGRRIHHHARRASSAKSRITDRQPTIRSACWSRSKTARGWPHWTRFWASKALMGSFIGPADLERGYGAYGGHHAARRYKRHARVTRSARIAASDKAPGILSTNEDIDETNDWLRARSSWPWAST